MSNTDISPETAIQTPWLRDSVAAYKAVVRPTTILACGIAVAVAAMREPALWEIVAIAAGVVTGVSYFRSLDKQGSVGTAPPPAAQ